MYDSFTNRNKKMVQYTTEDASYARKYVEAVQYKDQLLCVTRKRQFSGRVFHGPHGIEMFAI